MFHNAAKLWIRFLSCYAILRKNTWFLHGVELMGSATFAAILNGSVVQLDRISDFGSEGCRFESCRGHISAVLFKDGRFLLRLSCAGSSFTCFEFISWSEVFGSDSWVFPFISIFNILFFGLYAVVCSLNHIPDQHQVST